MALLIHHAVMRAAPHMPTSEVFARRKMLGETFVRLCSSRNSRQLSITHLARYAAHTALTALEG